MKIKCPSCLNIFQPNMHQEKLIIEATQKHQKLVMLECPECYKSIPRDPSDLLSAPNPPRNQEQTGCHVCGDGIIAYIDDGTECFWGCGECGSVWFSEKELEADKI